MHLGDEGYVSLRRCLRFSLVHYVMLFITKSCSIVVEPHWAAGRVGSLAATLSGSDSLEVFLGSTIALLVAARAFTKRLSRLIG